MANHAEKLLADGTVDTYFTRLSEQLLDLATWRLSELMCPTASHGSPKFGIAGIHGKLWEFMGSYWGLYPNLIM